ncbi:hypothetical protein [uncultured Ruegeria sp.]|uniref:hypothetical protein n=1 Tax=uncultured Ruegeria sp. TaxID=259304 RepID=UPI00261918A6|nr:hypothetical protein [uncultured Ruegeria sp.]
MSDLVLLRLEDGDIIRCTDLGDAKTKAISLKGTKGRIRVEITPTGGGRMTTLDFDHSSLDWVAAT